MGMKGYIYIHLHPLSPALSSSRKSGWRHRRRRRLLVLSFIQYTVFCIGFYIECMDMGAYHAVVEHHMLSR